MAPNLKDYTLARTVVEICASLEIGRDVDVGGKPIIAYVSNSRTRVESVCLRSLSK